jgi:hypothetical protein
VYITTVKGETGMNIGRWYFLVAEAIVEMIGRMFTLSIGLGFIVISLVYTYFTIVEGKITIGLTWPLLHFVQPIQIRDVIYSIIILLFGLVIITLIFILEDEENDAKE